MFTSDLQSNSLKLLLVFPISCCCCCCGNKQNETLKIKIHSFCMCKQLQEGILCALKTLVGKEVKNEMGAENTAQSILQ